jgi:hypothetical protein
MAVGFPTKANWAAGDVLTASQMDDFAGTLNLAVGYASVSAKTADYTSVVTDAYQVLITMNSSSAINFNIPTNATAAFAVGTVLSVLNIGAGNCTIKAVTSGTTTILSAGATAAQPILAQYKSAVCIKTATDAWYVVGAVA